MAALPADDSIHSPTPIELTSSIPKRDKCKGLFSDTPDAPIMFINKVENFIFPTFCEFINFQSLIEEWLT